MIRFYKQFLLLCLLGSGSIGSISAQSYLDEYLSYSVTAHYPDHTVVTYVKPADKVHLSDKNLYYWFSAGQVNVTRGGYSGKLLNGKYQDFYMDKSLRESGKFDRGLKTGEWRNWTNTGQLAATYSFKQGKKQGHYVKYDSTGRALEKGTYRDDLLDGRLESLAGDSTVVTWYKAGKVYQRKSRVPKFIYKLLPKKYQPKPKL